MTRALVTGATGFIGGHICKALLNAGYAVTAVTRSAEALGIHPDAKIVNVGEIGPDTDWEQALDGVDIVIHAAARAHALRDGLGGKENAYRRINFEATRALGTQAVERGVQRFIFLSSVKAGGEFSLPGRPLKADLPPAPEDAYGRTKLEAEAALLNAASAGKMEVLILRLPLVYGPGVKGNLFSLFNIVNQGMFLPLKRINNKRDLIYVHNLVDAVMRAIELHNFAERIYYVCDGESVSTSELVVKISRALNRPYRLIFVPMPIFKILALLVGKSGSFRKLTQSLEVDGGKFCRDADWEAPFTMKEGLASTAAWFKSQSVK